MLFHLEEGAIAVEFVRIGRRPVRQSLVAYALLLIGGLMGAAYSAGALLSTRIVSSSSGLAAVYAPYSKGLAG